MARISTDIYSTVSIYIYDLYDVCPPNIEALNVLGVRHQVPGQPHRRGTARKKYTSLKLASKMALAARDSTGQT
jgi:hypothetical protein